MATHFSQQPSFVSNYPAVCACEHPLLSPCWSVDWLAVLQILAGNWAGIVITSVTVLLSWGNTVSHWSSVNICLSISLLEGMNIKCLLGDRWSLLRSLRINFYVDKHSDITPYILDLLISFINYWLKLSLLKDFYIKRNVCVYPALILFPLHVCILSKMHSPKVQL